MSVSTPNRKKTSYSFSWAARYPAILVARPTQTGSTPVAIGSRVPAWPHFLPRNTRPTRSTARKEVIPDGLSRTITPSPGFTEEPPRGAG